MAPLTPLMLGLIALGCLIAVMLARLAILWRRPVEVTRTHLTLVVNQDLAEPTPPRDFRLGRLHIVPPSDNVGNARR